MQMWLKELDRDSRGLSDLAYCTARYGTIRAKELDCTVINFQGETYGVRATSYTQPVKLSRFLSHDIALTQTVDLNACSP